jgi:hypothetical protein
MKKLSILLMSLFLLYACGNSSEDPDDMQSIGANTSNGTSGNLGTVNDVPVAELNAQTNLLIADNFCANETKFKLLSTSLLSAFSAKGNGSDMNYCGGSSEFTENGEEFNIALTNYCVQFREQQVLLNGTINGVTDSGANFFSSIIPNVTIAGEGVDLSFSGNTWYGRADDMFMNLVITDHTTGNSIDLEETNIKKGEFDFGLFSFDEVGPYEFKFIKHFNADLTEGQLFIYGVGEELLILTAEEGIVTVVFKRDRHDPGVLVESSCSS